MYKIIVIVGATATFKTTLALKLSDIFDCEIINADAFQIYQELNVGTNKPKTNKHLHLLNEYSIYDEFDISIFQKRLKQLIEEINQRNKIIIICGGSNLYIDSVIKNYQLDTYPKREDITYFNDWTYNQIYQYVYEHNQVLALKINYHNQKRIIRAAQQIYWDSTHKNQPVDNDDNTKNQLINNCFMIETYLDKDLVYQRINQRVDQMINEGWYDEVKQLYEKDNSIISLKSMCAIGYKQILTAIINNEDIDVDKIKTLSRHYAKRQLTWNKNQYQNLVRFNYLEDDLNDLVHLINEWLMRIS